MWCGKVHFVFSTENVRCVVWQENGAAAAAAATGFEALH